VDTEIFGHYLQNWSSQWLCFFFIFEEQIASPVKILYSSLPETFLFAGQRRVECRFSDALYFFSTFKKLEVKGLTNLQDYFYNRTLTWKNRNIERVHLYSHLVCMVDPQ